MMSSIRCIGPQHCHGTARTLDGRNQSHVAARVCRCVDQLRQLTTFDVTWNGQAIPTSAWCGVVEGLPVYMLEPQQQAAFFWRGRFYGEVRAVYHLMQCTLSHMICVHRLLRHMCI
jgi:hypothetical protein